LNTPAKTDGVLKTDDVLESNLRMPSHAPKIPASGGGRAKIPQAFKNSHGIRGAWRHPLSLPWRIMSAPLTATGPPASPTDAVSKEKDVFTDSDGTVSSGYSTPAKAESLLLADRPKAYTTGRGPITDNFLNFFRIKGKHRDSEALDDIATQPSVYDGPQAQHYQPRDDWEVRYATCSW
jgi:hypothetical protein